jgi:hypothetical protein
MLYLIIGAIISCGIFLFIMNFSFYLFAITFGVIDSYLQNRHWNRIAKNKN